MKKLLYVILLLCSSINYAQTVEVKLKNNPENTTLSLRTIADTPLKEIKIEKGSSNSKNLNLKEGYYILKEGNKMAYVYLKPEDELLISFDIEDFVNTLSFSGKGSERNNYLIKKRLLEKKRRKDPNIFYKGDENDYLEKIGKINQDALNLLNSVSDNDFKNEEKINLKYDYLLDLLNYENLQKFYFGKQVEVSENYLEPIKNIDFDNSKLYNIFPSYRNMTSLKWKKDIEKAIGFDEMDKIFNAFKTQGLKKDVLISFYYSISKTPEKAEDYYRLIKKYVPNSKFERMAKEQFKNVQKTAKGNKSPNFKYEDINGKKVELKDFEGKYVFIDVWATWCMPCMQQIPYLKKLEEKYKNKNIVFLGISVDKKNQYNLWKETIQSKEMKGVQLFADNSFQSKFIKSYGISSIPRFILISPEGKIIDSNMSKPSEKRTEDFLDKLFN